MRVGPPPSREEIEEEYQPAPRQIPEPEWVIVDGFSNFQVWKEGRVYDIARKRNLTPNRRLNFIWRRDDGEEVMENLRALLERLGWGDVLPKYVPPQMPGFLNEPKNVDEVDVQKLAFLQKELEIKTATLLEIPENSNAVRSYRIALDELEDFKELHPTWNTWKRIINRKAPEILLAQIEEEESEIRAEIAVIDEQIASVRLKMRGYLLILELQPKQPNRY